MRVALRIEPNVALKPTMHASIHFNYVGFATPDFASASAAAGTLNNVTFASLAASQSGLK